MIENTRTSTLLSVITIAAAIPYLNSLHNDFLTWDDNIIILGQPFLRELTLENLWHMLSPVPAREEWLPLRDLTLAINFALFGADPRWFLLGNVLFHVGASLALFFLFLKLHNNRTGAFFGALFFACHAVHVESITWLSARKDPLSTLFLVLALSAYIRYRDRQGALADGSFCRLLPALGCFLLALLSKANAFIFPIWLLAYDSLFRRRLTFKERFLPVVPFALLSVGHLAFYVYQTSLDGVIESYPQGGLMAVLLTDIVLLKNYTLDVLLPLRHQVIYEVHFLRTPVDLGFVLALGLLTLIAWLAWRCRARPWIPLAIVLFYLNLVPYMNLVPHGIYYAERYLYLPSASFALLAGMLVACGLERQVWPPIGKQLIASLVVIYVSCHTVVTWKRNVVWADSETFWRYQAKEIPDNPAPWMNLGETYELMGDPVRAEKAYNAIAYQNGKFLPEALYRLARVARKNGEFDKALSLYNRYLDFKPRDPRALNNVAEIHLETGFPEEAVLIYEQTLSEHPRYLLARYNLARTLESLGRKKEARKQWQAIIDEAQMLPEEKYVLEARARLAKSRAPHEAHGEHE